MLRCLYIGQKMGYICIFIYQPMSEESFYEERYFRKQYNNFLLECFLDFHQTFSAEVKIRKISLRQTISIKNEKLHKQYSGHFSDTTDLFEYFSQRKEGEIKVEGQNLLLLITLQNKKSTKYIRFVLKRQNYSKRERQDDRLDDFWAELNACKANSQKLLKRSQREPILNKWEERLSKCQRRIKELQDYQKHVMTNIGDSVVEQVKETSKEKSFYETKSAIKAAPISKTKENSVQRPNPPSKQTGKTVAPQVVKLQCEPMPMSTSVSEHLIPQDLTFKIDKTNINVDFFYNLQEWANGKINVIRKNEDGMLYQVFSEQPIPQLGRFIFTFLLLKVSPGSISLGLITQDKKSLAHISDNEAGTIKMIAEQGYELYVDGRPTSNMLEQFQDETKIKMEINLLKKKKEVKIFSTFVGADEKQAWRQLGKIELPESMTKQRLYPFFQIKELKDSIILI